MRNECTLGVLIFQRQNHYIEILQISKIIENDSYSTINKFFLLYIFFKTFLLTLYLIYKSLIWQYQIGLWPQWLKYPASTLCVSTYYRYLLIRPVLKNFLLNCSLYVLIFAGQHPWVLFYSRQFDRVFLTL